MICRLALLLALLCAAPASAGTVLIDRPSGLGGLPPDAANRAAVSRHAVDDTGTYVVYSSESDALLPPGSADGERHVFRTNLQTGATDVVDTRADGTLGDGSATTPAISGNGKVVAFVDTATDLTGEAGIPGGRRVYVKDMVTGSVELIDRATGAGGQVADDLSRAPVLDQAGIHVAFATYHSLAGALDANGTWDVYLRDRSALTTTLISRTTGDVAADATHSSDDPAISDDGSAVAFTSDAPLVAADTHAAQDVYLRTGTTTRLISIAGTSESGDGYSDLPDVSADGNRVVFESAASNLVPDDGPEYGVFVRDVAAKTTTAVDRADGSATVNANAQSFAPAIDNDGTQVAFISYATNLTADAPAEETEEVYVRAVDLNATKLVSRHTGSGAAPAVQAGDASLSGDAAVAVFLGRDGSLAGRGSDEAQIYARRQATTSLVSGPASGLPDQATDDGRPAGTGHGVSDDGRYVVFSSDADSLSPDDDNDYRNVFRRDVVTGETLLISRGADGDSQEPAISADGTHVAFVTHAGSLGADPSGSVMVADVPAGTLTLVSPAQGEVPALDADGSRVAFTTPDALDPTDANGGQDVYVRDLAAGTTILASRRDGAGTPAGDNDSFAGVLDADGDRVAFTSAATDLGDGDTSSTQSIHLRDLTTQTTQLVSRANGPDGADANGTSESPSINASGYRVAFNTGATNLGDGDTTAARDVHLRDLGDDTTALASRVGADGPPAQTYAGEPALSADGTRVAFVTDDPSLLPGGTTGGQIMIRDLGKLTLALAGPAVDGYAERPSLSADGGCVAFGTEARGIEPDGFASVDYEHVHLRTVTGDCPMAGPGGVVPDPTPGPTASPSPAPTPDPGADLTRPRITRVRVTRQRIAFRLSEAAKVRIVIRHGKRAKVRRVSAQAGRNRVRVHLRKRRYRIVLRATDAAGNRSKAVTKRVRIRR